MSSERKEYYSPKERNLDFYIVGNDLSNEENSTAIPAKKLTRELSFNNELNKALKNFNKVPEKIQRETKRNSSEVLNTNIQYPSLPMQHNQNYNQAIPKAAFIKSYQQLQ